MDKLKEKFQPENYDNTCYIIGGGTSLINFNWTLLDDPNKFVIAINNTYSRLPNADILYCTDQPWVADHLDDLKHFKGTIYQGVLPNDRTKKFDVVNRRWILTGPHGLETKDGALRHGSNSTFAAINMSAVHLGFNKIYLLGIDMKWGKRGVKKTSHWHSAERPHKRVDAHAVYDKMRKAYDTIKQPLLDHGVEVINLNHPDRSDLRVFPMVSPIEHFKKELDTNAIV